MFYMKTIAKKKIEHFYIIVYALKMKFISKRFGQSFDKFGTRGYTLKLFCQILSHTLIGRRIFNIFYRFLLDGGI
jgi:hypothetical protein